MECAIKRCNCQNEWQDERYGKFMRVFNPMGKKGSKQPTGYRCSVCGAVTHI